MRTNCRFAMAVHVLTLLAYKDGDPVSSEFLSASVNTNPVIIRRLLLLLQQAKLVETRKGAKAGSRLSRSAARITLAEVYRAVADSQPFKVPRRKPNGKCPVGHGIRAALKPVFISAQAALERDLASTTLAGIVESIKVSTRLA
ncbi:MAG TPA: Rrf2 family transcriptional regulator [Bacillota bacterium]|nr:Rrf2 family transcriptional regulator [Bacillota bacterium]